MKTATLLLIVLMIILTGCHGGKRKKETYPVNAAALQENTATLQKETVADTVKSTIVRQDTGEVFIPVITALSFKLR